MSTRIRYAYCKGHTWLYRRNYPVDVALALGSEAYKQSLKTRPASEARVRAAEGLAARAQGFADADAYWQWLADDVVNRAV